MGYHRFLIIVTLKYLKNVIKFDKNHSTIFVRVIETFLLKSILNVYNEKNGLYSWKINPTMKEERDVTTTKLKSLNLIDWFSEISRLIPQVIHLFYLRITLIKGNSSSFTQVLIIKQKLHETFYGLSPGPE